MNDEWVDDLQFSRRRGLTLARPKEPESPYFQVPEAAHREVTLELLRRHPLPGPILRDVALESWEDIFSSRLGPARIGVHLRPAPQIMGFFLHELIPLRVSMALREWRRDARSTEKDLVYIPDQDYSIEIKTSSNRDQVFGNRSFGQPAIGPGKKAKSGYYLTVNFQRWADTDQRPEITTIRYGWLDSTDWIAQAAASGQNSSLPAAVYNNQLPILYERE